jgi:Na+-transporting NADH:ubiquinone oxidoreductase subunit F
LQQIIIAIAVFTLIVLLLVAIVLIAHAWLVPSGTARITVNGLREIDTRMGDRLLSALSAQGIFLPAACGGRGTCGQCKVIITSGARDLLATEAVHIHSREAAAGTRLACMLTVRGNLDIRVPTTVLEARQWQCKVQSTRSVTTFLKELVLVLPEGEHIQFEAGEYILLEAPPCKLSFADFDIDPEYRAEWQRYRLLELRSEIEEPTVRAYSLANPPAENDRIKLIVRIATPPHNAPAETPPGKVSSFVFSLKPGDTVRVSGPFGDFHAHESDKEMIFIAGGAGLAPMHSMICDQLSRVGTNRKMTFWYGARNMRELCYTDEFDALAASHANFSWNVALSEPVAGSPWTGHRGFIHSIVYEQYLKNHPAPEEAEYYLCGPPLMSAAVMHMLEDLGVENENIYFDDFGA